MPSNAPGKKEWNAKYDKTRKLNESRMAGYVQAGKRIDRTLGPATPEEKATERDMGRAHNLMYKPQDLTKSTKYR